MKFPLLGLLSILLTFGVGQSAPGGVIIASHSGSADPTTEGFSTVSIDAPSTAGPLANDLGRPAWEITGTGQSAQFAYLAPGFNSGQLTDIGNEGFTLTMVARVLQNGLAPAYDSTNFIVIGGADTSYLGRRWEVDLGINANGDTVVALPTSVDNAGPGLSIRTPGPSYTLAGSGSSYHTYDLVYDHVSGSADLFVDGTLRIANYGGHTSFVGSSALVWGAWSGGEGNFNLVELQTGAPTAAPAPEPGTLALCTGGFSLIGLYRFRRRRGCQI